MNTPGQVNPFINVLPENRERAGLRKEKSTYGYNAAETEEQVFYTFIHDMKNPLATSRGFLSRLLSGKAGSMTKKQKDYLEIICCNHEEIESLLNLFLDILNARSKLLVPDFNTFDIVLLVSKITDTMNIVAEQKDMTICFENSYHVLDVCADSMMVTRIFRNLLDNSLKHTLSGGKITVIISDRDDDVLIKIIDTGNGIPSISFPYIFNPFYQARKDGKGSGLGLYIVKQLIELQGGDIWMEGIHGKGTSVSFTLLKKRQ